MRTDNASDPQTSGDDRSCRGAVAVVTGAAQGMGADLAEALHRRGARTYIVDNAADRLCQTAAKLGADCEAFPADVSSPEEIEGLFNLVRAREGRLDILVNNAAIMLYGDRPFKPFWEIELPEWQRVMAVNAQGAFLTCKYGYPLMASNRSGRIVNITSDAIWHGYAGQLAYFASKGALDAMTRCLARELGEFGIAVNAVAPGLTMTESVRNSPFLGDIGPTIREGRALRRDQHPADVVGAVMFLCGPDASAITGQTLVVNSGGLMR